MVVHEQSHAHHPGRTHRCIVRHDELRGPYQMRRDAQHDLALLQGLADQSKFVVLQIAQAPMHHLRTPLAGRRGNIALLDQADPEAAAGRVSRNATAIDPRANDGKVERLNSHAHRSRKRSSHRSEMEVFASVMRPLPTMAIASSNGNANTSRNSPSSRWWP